MYEPSNNQMQKLQDINDKYYGKIKNAYGRYIKNFDQIPDMTQNIFIVPDDECTGDYADLVVGKNRGRCDANTGNIYIRESAFYEHLLVHEFIHRLSRNKIKLGLLKKQWIEGIMYLDKKVALYGLNEVLTEWLAFNITNHIENNIYQQEFTLIVDIKKHHNLLEKIIGAYFCSNKDELFAFLYDVYGTDAYREMNDLDSRIRSIIP